MFENVIHMTFSHSSAPFVSLTLRLGCVPWLALGVAELCRKAAAMAMYRNIEEAWERQQEEKESTKRVEAAKRKIELEVLVRA